MRPWLTIRALQSLVLHPRGVRHQRALRDVTSAYGTLRAMVPGPGACAVLAARVLAARVLAARVLAAGVVLAACSAPDGSELFVPFELADRGVGGAVGIAGSGAAGANGGSAAGGASSGEGQGGLEIAAGGAGATLGMGASGESSDPRPMDAGAPDATASVDAAPEPPACVPGDERCDGVDNDCDGEIDPGATCAAQCAGFARGELGYMFCSSALSRGAAQARCQAAGMRLAWLETPEESEALVAGIRAADVPAPVGNAELLTHIGASDAADEGEWFWVGNGVAPGGPQFWEGASAEQGGEVVDDAYEAWAPLEPNDEGGEDCAVISVFGSAIREPGQWDDRDCTLQLPFVCEAP